jgi:hypothetical protein
MKVTYKKRAIVGKGLHSGPMVTTQDVQLEIHYEAESLSDPSKKLTCEPYELGVVADGVVYLWGYPAVFSTLRLVIEEVIGD